jgi:hypothetical protein
MQLSRDNGSTAVTAAQLESWPDFRARVIRDLKNLEDLRNAPVVSADDYHGPVLFSGDAASDVLGRLVLPNIEAERPDMGTTARTRGVYNSSLHARVMPEFLDVIDDPLQADFKGRGLVVPIVEDGKLQNYLMSRTPIRDFPASNGHGRAALGQGARASAGVIIVKSKTPLSADAMNQKLLALAKEQKRDVYAVDTLTGGTLAPRVLYLVHPDGTRQLVRGAVFDELDHRSLRSDILAAGDDPYVSNSLGAVPETTIAPSLLFDDIGVKRATQENDKLPYYPPPPAAAGK